MTRRPGRSPSKRPRRGRRTAGTQGRKGRETRRGKRTFHAGRVLALFLLASVLALGSLFVWSVLPGTVAGPPGEVVHFRVTTSDKTEVMESLEGERLLSSPLLAKLYVLLLTPTADFEPRAHLLTSGISARELVQRLAQKGSRPTRKVTFPEGWTHLQMARRLEESQICSELGFQAAVFDEELLEELALASESAEGFLFPAQYELAVDTDPRDVVRRLVKEARQRYSALVERRPMSEDLQKFGFGELEVFTLASIVEKETSVAAEAPRIARVFLNRLLLPEAETKGRLQSDPTAGYGCLVDPAGPPSCRNYKKHILPEMLQDAKNPYNTYRQPGLPPGAISNPGERSLQAVLHPADGAELYFVADGNGTHSFSLTYSEHRKAVERLKEIRPTEMR